MQKPTEQTTKGSAPTTEKQPRFIGRLFQKLDKSLKDKADQQAQQSGSCCSDDDKSGKRC